MAKKNMIIAMILSIIWSGLGLIYAGDMKKGIILAVLAIIFEILLYMVNHYIKKYTVFNSYYLFFQMYIKKRNGIMKS